MAGIHLALAVIAQFAEDNDIQFAETEPGRFEAEGITLLNRDLFALRPDELAPIDIVWDRASPTAFPDDCPNSLRQHYIDTMYRLAPAGHRIFLLTIEYGPIMAEPPFSAGSDMVRDYFGGAFDICMSARHTR